MFATFPRTRNQRRGVVLILVLGMLGLLALIGVTFATFSGQVKVNARNFSQAQNWPESSEMMDYALAQLIDDTDNPQSAIRGHSLKRDMYGRDGIFNSALPYNPADGSKFEITAISTVTGPLLKTITDVDGTRHDVSVSGLIRVQTNIAAGEPALYGYNFTRWILKFPPVTEPAASAAVPASFYVGETHEVLADADEGSFRVFYVAPHDNSYGDPADIMPTPTVPTEAPGPGVFFSQAPTIPYPLPSFFPPTSYQAGGTNPYLQYYNFYNYANTGAPGQSKLIGLNGRFLIRNTVADAVTFTLDGRFLHAFNGPGVAALNANLSNLDPTNSALANRGMGQYGNFRTNGNILSGTFDTTNNFNTPASYGNPNQICGMDEDYDACDLENWFLAMQSGDGQVMIPSFHRPGILVRDGSVNDPITGAAPFDDWTSDNVFSASKILRPRAADGHNSLAFPNLYPDSNGKVTYDVDNDGDGSTDSVWLDLGYPARRNTDGRFFKPLFAFMIIGLNGRIPLNTAGNLQLRSLFDPATGAYGVSPRGSHASHKGFSPSEIDPTFGLQNAFIEGVAGLNKYSPVDNAGADLVTPQPGTFINGVFTPGDNTGPGTFANSPWWGTAGVPVSLTQLRNLLAGTRLPMVYKNTFGVDVTTSNDANFVVVDGKKVFLPNAVLDSGDPANPAVTLTTPIAGRWGEPTDQPTGLTATPWVNVPGVAPWPTAPPIYYYENQVRAGLSGQWTSAGPLYGDGRDDNHNAFDWYPRNPVGATAPVNAASSLVISTLGENADLFDDSGSLVLPVERLRRFVTPIDVMGDGFVNSFKTPFPTTPLPTAPIGADENGRVAFVKHFRPPGVAVATPPGLALPGTLLASNPHTPGAGPIWYPYENNSYWLKGIGNPAPPTSTTVVGPATHMIPVDLTNNLFHGFEGYRLPRTPGGLTALSTVIGGMPFNNYPAVPAAPPNPWVPTYDQTINTVTQSANLNEADEMQLYRSQPSDQPFGPSDLEWLYRQQDVDGLALSSRLRDLAPVSFLNPKDGNRRRRLFSIETWEPTNFVWAHDNPVDDPQWPVVTALPASAPYGNSQFISQSDSANLSTLSYHRDRNASVYDQTATDLAYTVPRRLPSLAHGDRKINLNFPLPVSNRYDEPVRQKWIRETYQLLKLILPPKAVDTPEELVQLSQFVVNIIDYRDPDCTSTRFVNTDVFYSACATPTTPAVLSFTPRSAEGTWAGVGWNLLGNPWHVNTAVAPPEFSSLYDNQNSPYVIQQGMEYNPVAINEVLAYQYRYDNGGSPSVPTPRMCVELVNTLTAPTDVSPPPVTVPPYIASSDSTACDLTLNGWDFIILPDDYTGRPDPFTGQLPLAALPNPVIPPAPPRGVTTSNRPLAAFGDDPGGLTRAIEAIDSDVKYYVIQDKDLSTPAAPAKELLGTSTTGLTADATIDLVNNTILSTAPTQRFYWLYLRRPANPFDTSYDPARPNENRVVVDAFRFIYNSMAGTVDTMGAVTPGGNGGLYSLERLQPFRGGHAVAAIPIASAPANYCVPTYGYTEQTRRGPASSATNDPSTLHLVYGPTNDPAHNITGYISNTLGRAIGATNGDEVWDYLPFNDRDFTSVSELLMVPGCPPGLFTKQFVEQSPEIVGTIPPELPALAGSFAGMPPNPLIFKKATTPVTGTATSRPHTFPYLMDEFFYTAQSEPSVPGAWPDPGSGLAPIHSANSNYGPNFPITKVNTTLLTHPTYIGGPSGAGWHRMFEFFDVPTPANGSIDIVAKGVNYDWMRQDLRPGLLNINLIIDEEVFFAVMSETWLKTLGFVRNFVAPYSPAQEDLDNLGSTRLNVQQIEDNKTPLIVTQVNLNGSPNSSYRMPNQGFMALDPRRSEFDTSTAPFFGNKMKAAFSDFLKLRHGGSDYMFAHQSGPVSDPLATATSTQIASERPYRSFSYPDINYTLLRPAALPPTDTTLYPPWLPPWADYIARLAYDNTFATSTTPPIRTYIGDPGVKNPYLFTSNNPVQPPPIPPRRLFQLPDVWGNPTIGFPTAAPAPPSHASIWLTPYGGTASFTGDPFINWLNPNNNLSNIASDLSAKPTVITSLDAGNYNPPQFVVVPNFYLGANTVDPAIDNRQHPAFRYDWLQKVTNLTTVRTHQYAVWITVGFFEVIKQGDPMVGNTASKLAFDTLGQELNIQNGTNTRYRSFFIIDRTRAVGFSPQAPGNFRECVVYRQPIE
ncbi:hypothetical protein V5E97_20090 [Singulisphaera sp. Ch08]|uniref:Verru_Chthon cassette protein A n=1 Tax=Singulisphaera sp. Ch08 TaxID=3120278 RepID=A0AAU7CTI3_9BACT